MVIMQRDAKSIRISMKLPTYEVSADAKYGFHGGRHAQVLVQLKKAGVTPHDWLLIDNLLRRYTIRVQVKYRNGTRSYSPALKPSRGGMVQGLSSSSPLYTLLPRVLQDMVGQEILCAVVRIHPQLLEAYHMTNTGDATAMQDLDTDHTRMQGWTI